MYLFKQLTLALAVLIATNSEATASFDALPRDVQVYIFAATQIDESGIGQPILALSDLGHCAQVCRMWNENSSADLIWEARAKQYYRFSLELYKRNSKIADAIFTGRVIPCNNWIAQIDNEEQPTPSKIKLLIKKVKGHFSNASIHTETPAIIAPEVIEKKPLYKTLLRHKSDIGTEIGQTHHPSLISRTFANPIEKKLMVAVELLGDDSLTKCYLNRWVCECSSSMDPLLSELENAAPIRDELDLFVQLGSVFAANEIEDYRKRGLFGYGPA